MRHLPSGSQQRKSDSEPDAMHAALGMASTQTPPPPKAMCWTRHFTILPCPDGPQTRHAILTPVMIHDGKDNKDNNNATVGAITMCPALCKACSPSIILAGISQDMPSSPHLPDEKLKLRAAHMVSEVTGKKLGEPGFKSSSISHQGS